LIAELIGIGANVVAIGALGFIVFKLIDVVIGLRADPTAELEGLDIPEMGVPGYVGVTDGLRMPELTSTHQMAAPPLPLESRR